MTLIASTSRITFNASYDKLQQAVGIINGTYRIPTPVAYSRVLLAIDLLTRGWQ